MATSKKVVTRGEWEGKLRDAKIHKEDMNFLVTEGLVDAAHRFRLESGTQPEIDLATIIDRMEVKKAVQSGNVQEAVERINDLNPTVPFCPSFSQIQFLFQCWAIWILESTRLEDTVLVNFAICVYM
ncbi:pg4 [Hordeum vulgare]|nr:pg4 [Hordeum vulgare]